MSQNTRERRKHPRARESSVEGPYCYWMVRSGVSTAPSRSGYPFRVSRVRLTCVRTPPGPGPAPSTPVPLLGSGVGRGRSDRDSFMDLDRVFLVDEVARGLYYQLRKRSLLPLRFWILCITTRIYSTSEWYRSLFSDMYFCSSPTSVGPFPHLKNCWSIHSGKDTIKFSGRYTNMKIDVDYFDFNGVQTFSTLVLSVSVGVCYVRN